MAPGFGYPSSFVPCSPGAPASIRRGFALYSAFRLPPTIGLVVVAVAASLNFDNYVLR